MKAINNKRYVPALILITIGLWATIGYRIYDRIKGSDESKIVPMLKPTLVERPDTLRWKPNFNFKDPFLKEKKKPTSRKKSSEVREPNVKSATEEQTIQLPVDVRYLGYISGTVTGNETFLLEIDKETKILSAKQEIRGMKVKEIFADSIILTFKNQDFVLLK